MEKPKLEGQPEDDPKRRSIEEGERILFETILELSDTSPIRARQKIEALFGLGSITSLLSGADKKKLEEAIAAINRLPEVQEIDKVIDLIADVKFT